MPRKILGPLLIALAALLWGTDSVFRCAISREVQPLLIVFAEHLLGVFLILPIAIAFHGRNLFKLSVREWTASVFVGSGGSALGMAFYTASFLYINPSESILLQKLSPIIVVLIAYSVLGEKPNHKFYLWALVAILAGIFLSFPSLNFDIFKASQRAHIRGVFYSLIAMILWSISIVAGKILLKETSPLVATFWRYAFGLLTLTAILVMPQSSIHWESLKSIPAQKNLLYLVLFTGILPMTIYYAGLARTSASVSSFIGLLYPVGSVILTTLILKQPLNGIQMIAAVALLYAVSKISNSLSLASTQQIPYSQEHETAEGQKVFDLHSPCPTRQSHATTGLRSY